eukprot:scaffold952_cov409-Prasinococcus_capsulatus_cf.AAC.17
MLAPSQDARRHVMMVAGVIAARATLQVQRRRLAARAHTRARTPAPAQAWGAEVCLAAGDTGAASPAREGASPARGTLACFPGPPGCLSFALRPVRPRTHAPSPLRLANARVRWLRLLWQVPTTLAVAWDR